MICGHCHYWHLLDRQQIVDGAPKAQHRGVCRNSLSPCYKSQMVRVSTCEQWEREPGTDDDQGEYGQAARYGAASND